MTRGSERSREPLTRADEDVERARAAIRLRRHLRVIGVLPLATLVVVSAFATRNAADGVTIRVVDAVSRTVVADAIITLADKEARTDPNGAVLLDATGNDVIHVRAPGYERANVSIQALRDTEIPLKPVRPKALYLSVYGIGDKKLRSAALTLIDTTELNALVIDVKGDRGLHLDTRAPTSR